MIKLSERSKGMKPYQGQPQTGVHNYAYSPSLATSAKTGRSANQVKL